MATAKLFALHTNAITSFRQIIKNMKIESNKNCCKFELMRKQIKDPHFVFNWNNLSL